MGVRWVDENTLCPRIYFAKFSYIVKENIYLLEAWSMCKLYIYLYMQANIAQQMCHSHRRIVAQNAGKAFLLMRVVNQISLKIGGDFGGAAKFYEIHQMSHVHELDNC